MASSEANSSSSDSSAWIFVLVSIFIFLILFFWYKWISDKNKLEREENIQGLEDTVEAQKEELQALKAELKGKRYTEGDKETQGILEVIGNKMDQIMEEFKRNKLGEDYEKTDNFKTEEQLKKKLEDLMEKNQDLRRTLEETMKSVVMPETQHIISKVGEDEATPEYVVRSLLNELEQSRYVYSRVQKENKDLSTNYCCLLKQIQLKEQNILELQEQVEVGEKQLLANKLLNQQLVDLKAEVEALKRINDQKYAAMTELIEENRKKDSLIQKLDATYQEESCIRKQEIGDLNRILKNRGRVIREASNCLEELINTLKCITNEISPSNIREVKEILYLKICDLQSNIQKMSSNNAADESAEVEVVPNAVDNYQMCTPEGSVQKICKRPWMSTLCNLPDSCKSTSLLCSTAVRDACFRCEADIQRSAFENDCPNLWKSDVS